MIIANPIYDTVFKKMMESERVAKFFIGTLLEQDIETVEVQPQEFTYTDQLARLAVFRHPTGYKKNHLNPSLGGEEGGTKEQMLVYILVYTVYSSTKK